MLLALAQMTIERYMPPVVIEDEDFVRVDISYDPPEPILNPVISRTSNLNMPTNLEQYQELVKKTAMPHEPVEPLLERQTDLELAELFIYQFTKASYITQLTEDQFKFEGVQGLDAVAYLRKPTAAFPNFWQICMIITKYGNIYLSSMLDDDGFIPNNTAGVFITFDSESTETILHGAFYENLKRFDRQYTLTRANKIQRVQDLEFLLGDKDHQFTVSSYM